MNGLKIRRQQQIQGVLLRIGVAVAAALCARAFSGEPLSTSSGAPDQKRMLVVRPNQCASTRVLLLEYSPEARPLAPTLLVVGKSY